ncbi:MAG: hypothetical protein ACI4DP_01400 [Candidatus Ornithomonoglobus sp.]
MNKTKPKKNSKLSGAFDSGVVKKKENSRPNETIGGSIERRAKLSKLGSKKAKLALIFLIKTVETFAASVVPSVLSVLIIFLNPNEKSWAVMKVVSFLVTAYVNWRLWLKYAAMKSGPKEFYLMNGLTYLLYFASSVIGYYTLGYLVYSMTYANLRVFEIWGMRTIHSIWCSNGIMVLILICCERFSHIRFNKFLEWTRKNGSDKVEMEDILTDDTPVQQDKIVETLSIEELAENIDQEEYEAIEAKKRAMEMMPEGTFDEEKITKGHGEKVERVDAVDMDNDLTEGDFNAFAAAQEEYEQNMQYSGDSLWSRHIYAGRTADGKPITEYEEEDMREAVWQKMESYDTADADDDSLWDKSIYQGRHAANGLNIMDPDEEDASDDDKIDYDADALWESGFYQGRSKDSIPQRTLDLDDILDERTTENSVDDAADALWGSVSQGRGKKVQRLEDIEEEDNSIDANLNADYDTDSLWDNVYQGRKK